MRKMRDCEPSLQPFVRAKAALAPRILARQSSPPTVVPPVSPLPEFSPTGRPPATANRIMDEIGSGTETETARGIEIVIVETRSELSLTDPRPTVIARVGDPRFLIFFVFLCISGNLRRPFCLEYTSGTPSSKQLPAPYPEGGPPAAENKNHYNEADASYPRKDGTDWFAEYPTQDKRTIDVRLVHTLTHERCDLVISDF
jgi:hypothetical protein